MSARRRRVGIIKPCCIGDAVLALPVIDNLRHEDSEQSIEVWCGRHTRPVFDAHPGVTRIVEIPSVPRPRDVPGLVWNLRASKNDGLYVLDRSRLIASACRLAGAPVLGTVRAAPAATEHEIDRYLDTLRQAGVPVTVTRPTLAFDDEAVRGARAKVGVADGRYVMLQPGGARNPGVEMLSKRWPAANWREVVRWLDARSLHVVLTGSQDERPLCETIASGTRASVAAGKLELMESAALASGALAYVGPDTGMSQLAAATGVPVVAIFGPTNPRQYGPRGEHATILAPPGSTDISDVDLRKAAATEVPSTAEIPAGAVIEALDAFLSEAGPKRC